VSEWTKPGTAEAPRRGDFLPPMKELTSSLLGVEVLEFVENVERPGSKYGPKDTIYANVKVFDGKHAGSEFNNTPIDSKVLVRQLKSQLGQKVLGRVDRDIDNNGAFFLAEPKEEDFELASGAAKKSGPFG
jgi:hypothetical protein